MRTREAYRFHMQSWSLSPKDIHDLLKQSKKITRALDGMSIPIVKNENVPPRSIVLLSRFVPTIKNFKKNQYFKARLVILGYIDHEKSRLVNKAPTVLISSVRLALELVFSYVFKIYSRYISQLFIRSNDPLHRIVFVRPPKGEDIKFSLSFDPSISSTA